MTFFVIIKITDKAKEYLTNTAISKDKPYVRFSVKGGGCAGFQYKWEFENEVSENDELFEFPQGQFVVDKQSILYVAGTTIDYVKEVWGSSFQIKNPNATSSCGCGESFAV